MRVATLLAKDKAGKLFHKHGEHDEGGKAEDIDTQRWHGRLMARQGRKLDGSLKTAFKLEGETNFQGLDIAIENRVGSVRKGTNEDGTKWETRFHVPYGYLRGTKGADDEPIDCYVGPHKDSSRVFVARQKNDDGSHDEDTVMLGYDSSAAAKKDILRHYDDPKYIGAIVPVGLDRLKAIVEAGQKVDKIASVNADHHYLNGVDPGTTGLPAQPRRRRGDVPSRDDTEPYPAAKTEQRGDITSTVQVNSAAAPGGFDDLGKYSAAIETLGQAVRSWEVPSSDEPSEHGGTMRQGTSGLVEAPSPARTGEDKELRGPFHLSLSEIGSSASQDGDNTKGAAATNRFPKPDRVEDNTLDAQKMGDRAADLDEGAKTAMTFGFGPDGQFYVGGELVPVRETRGEKLAHIMLQSFFEHIEKLSVAQGVQHRESDAEQFRKVAADLFYVASSMPLTKEALGFASIGQGIKNVAGKLRPGAGAAVASEVPNFRKGVGFFSPGIGKDLHAGGKMLAHNPRAAGQAAGLGAKDVNALGAMKPSNAASRIAGETAVGAGHHLEHANAGLMALNPVGVPMGGAIEGFTRGVGRELQNVGHKGVQSAGRLMQKHAPKVGLGGELLAGGLLHTPGLAAQAGAALAPGAAGAVQHLLGAGAQEMYSRAPKLVPRAMQMAKNVGGRLGFG